LIWLYLVRRNAQELETEHKDQDFYKLDSADCNLLIFATEY